MIEFRKDYNINELMHYLAERPLSSLVDDEEW
jgi:hypothetical protein